MPRRIRAISLVETLITVTLIAAVMSLLMAGLSGARRQARGLVCQAHLKDIGVGVVNYGLQFNHWIPGAPGTSGLQLIQTIYGADGDPSRPYTSTAIDLPVIPTQAWDWAGPTAYWGMGWVHLPKHRAQRMAQLREGVFRCPDNNRQDLTYPYTQQHRRWPATMRWNSYATIREFMYFGRDPSRSPLTHLPPNWDVHTPRHYQPQMTAVHRPASKVLLAEGTPHWPDHPQSPHNFDVRYNTRYGGAFSTAGASSSWARGYPSTPGRDDRREQFVYRHRLGNERAMQVLLFDGHVEALTRRRAVEEVDQWYPSGTAVNLDEFDAGPFPKPEALALVRMRPADARGFRPIY